MTAADEYLEGVVKDAFDRELDVDEDVARTLPFFAATLALAVSLYGYAAGKLPPFAGTPLSVFLHGLLAAGSLCLLPILWAMFQAVRVREYRIPPREMAQIQWAEELKAHYAAQGFTPKTVDARVTAQLRNRMIVEYAESAEHNRAANLPKLKARALGLTLSVVMLSVAFFMIGTIFITERATLVDRTGARHEPKTSDVGIRPAGERAKVAAPAAAVPSVAGGREVPPGAGGEHSQRLTTVFSSGQGAATKPIPATQAR